MTPQIRLARLASRQHGVVATWQLLLIGYSRHQIARAVSAGVLHRLHRGVYAVGHTKLTRRARWMAAVLAFGPDAVLSHRTAAALHQLRPAPRGYVEVTACGTHRSRPGLKVHCVRRLHRDDCTLIDGIPVTALERTLLDYAETSDPQQTRLAVEAALRTEELDMRRIRAMLARSPGRRGRKPLIEALGQVADVAPWTQSETERRLLAAVRAAGLPEPSTNVVVDGELVDFYWRPERLIVEVDGDFWHKTPAARERDRRRDVRLQLGGQSVARFGDGRVNHELRAVVDEIQALLKFSAGRAEASGR